MKTILQKRTKEDMAKVMDEWRWVDTIGGISADLQIVARNVDMEAEVEDAVKKLFEAKLELERIHALCRGKVAP